MWDHPLDMVPRAFLERKLVIQLLDGLLPNARPCEERGIFEHAWSLQVASAASHFAQARCTAVAVARIPGSTATTSSAPISHRKGNATPSVPPNCRETHITLLQSLLILPPPSQRLRNPPVPQTLRHPARLHENLQIHQIFHALLPRQLARTLPIPIPEQIIHQQPIQPHTTPLIELHIRQTRDRVEVLQVLDPLSGLEVEFLFFGAEGFDFAF